MLSLTLEYDDKGEHDDKKLVDKKLVELVYPLKRRILFSRGTEEEKEEDPKTAAGGFTRRHG
jgi:hypothetical protein